MNAAKKNALAVIGIGLAFEVTGFGLNAVLAPGPRLAQMFSLAISLGAAILIVGCVQLARAKGRPWYLGLLGFLSFVGVAILWFLVPDKTRR